MSNVNAAINRRLEKKEKASTKMASLAKETASGNMTTFAGLFSVGELSETEKEQLESLLVRYAPEDVNNFDVEKDLHSLAAITSEVKAITNQAALLHGERIQRAQTLLKKYQEGAFTAWLMSAYGNRQTPYNFLHYHEFHQKMPQTMHPQIEQMPRQAVYLLASREGKLEEKKKIVVAYQGETKAELLEQIRTTFPLDDEDGRRHSPGDRAINTLASLYSALTREKPKLTSQQRESIQRLLKMIGELGAVRE